MGWAQLGNGQLLRAAASAFDLLITTDQNLRHQQNLGEANLAILVLPTTSWPIIQRNVNNVRDVLDRLKPGEFRELVFDR